MFRIFSKKDGDRIKGFTLIELLVVIAIIGVLASIVLASLNSARQKSRDARRITDVKQIQLALELYFDGTGANQYPVATTGATNCTATLAYGLQVLATSNYIPQIPRDPNMTGVDACYAYATPSSGTRTTYHLGSSLEDTAHPALSGDKDCSSSGTADCVSGITTAYTGGFAGGTGGTTESAGACITTTVTTRRCYDVIP